MPTLTLNDATSAEEAVRTMLRVAQDMRAAPELLAGLRLAANLTAEARHAAYCAIDLAMGIDGDAADTIRREVADRWLRTIAGMPIDTRS